VNIFLFASITSAQLDGMKRNTTVCQRRIFISSSSVQKAPAIEAGWIYVGP